MKFKNFITTILILSILIFSGCSLMNKKTTFREGLVNYTSQFENAFLALDRNKEDILTITGFVKKRFSQNNTKIEKRLLNAGHLKENFEYYGDGSFWRSYNYQLNDGLVSISYYKNGILESIEERNNGINYYKRYNQKGVLVYSSDGKTTYQYYEGGILHYINYENGDKAEFDKYGRKIYRSWNKGKDWVKWKYYSLNGIDYVETLGSNGSWSKWGSNKNQNFGKDFSFNRYDNTLSLLTFHSNYYSAVNSKYFKVLILDLNKAPLASAIINSSLNISSNSFIYNHRNFYDSNYNKITEKEAEKIINNYRAGGAKNNPKNLTYINMDEKEFDNLIRIYSEVAKNSTWVNKSLISGGSEGNLSPINYTQKLEDIYNKNKDYNESERKIRSGFNLMLNREPNKNELTTWDRLYSKSYVNMTILLINLSYSKEFKKNNKLISGSNKDYIKIIINKLLFREPTKIELDAWSKVIDDNTFSREEVFKKFVEGGEFRRLIVPKLFYTSKGK